MSAAPSPTAPLPPRAPRFVCDTPRPSDTPDLLAVQALPMPGPIGLSLRTQPDPAHAAALRGDRHHTAVVRDRTTGRVVAAGSRSVRELWLDGRVQRIGYLSTLRNHPGVRLPRRLIADAFHQLAHTRAPDETPFDFTSILADNTAARRALERGVRGLPTYTPLGEVVTCTLAARRRRTVPGARPARATDLPLLCRLLGRHGQSADLRPHWTVNGLTCPDRTRGLSPHNFVVLERGGQAQGCGALWDQRASKQTVVTGLAPTLARWRPAVNLGCRLSGRVGLPRPPSELGLVYASHLAFSDPATAVALLHALQRSAADAGASALAFGLPSRHPLLAHRSLRLRAWRSRSVLYAVHHGPPPALNTENLWPEIAVL